MPRLTPGKESTEHKRALRAEALGSLAVVGGFASALATGDGLYVLLSIAGVALVGLVSAVYSHGRAKAKIAAATLPPRSSPPSPRQI